jgi:uncharacterized protein (TIGR03437 family)
MVAAAPGIFADTNSAVVPVSTAKRGQFLTVYMTGAGAVSPSVSTGATPGSSTPVPVGDVLVTVGGVPATASYVGVPSWSVGVVQINFTVPSNAPVGSQPVVVSIGGVASAGATVIVN